MSLIENLKAAKALISDPSKWLQGDLSSNGCLCTIGAIGEARGWDVNAFDTPEATTVAQQLGASDTIEISRFNDLEDTTHGDIMDLFDRAIAAAERSVASC